MVERGDLLDDGVAFACGGGLCNVKVALKLLEAVAGEGLDDVFLSAAAASLSDVALPRFVCLLAESLSCTISQLQH